MTMKIETARDEWAEEFSGPAPFLAPAQRRAAHANLDALGEVMGGRTGLAPEVYAILDELIDSESSAAGFVARRLSALVEG